MKRFYTICIFAWAASAVLCPAHVTAQGSKQVEVTKVYVPQVSDAQKLAVGVDMTDTVRMRPEIDYSITPHMWQTSLKMRDFKPATATYWDYNRSKMFYARLAAGYPLTTAGDLYLTTHNPKVGYAGVYVNHEGDFERRRTALLDERLSMGQSSSMRNRAGVRGGIYAGRRMAEIDIDYRNDMFHRYAVASSPRLQYADMGGGIRFGDDFADLSRVNFNVELHGRHWRDCRLAEGEQSKRITSFGASVSLAREWSGSRLDFDIAYDQWIGRKALDEYGDRQATVALKYSRSLRRSTLSLGLGYKYDKVKALSPSHFVMPSVRLAYDKGSAALAPYVELETSVTGNSFASLVELNPYLGFDERTRWAIVSMPSTRSYCLRAGFTGVAGRGRLAYRAYAGVSFVRDQIFWYNYGLAWFGADSADNIRFVVDAEIEYRPIGALTIGGGITYHADNTSTDLRCCDPRIEGEFKIRYKHRRFVVAAGVEVTGKREWSVMDSSYALSGVFSSPVTADVSLGLDWLIDSRWTVYVEGRNLADMKLYDWANYYRNSINFQAGVKINF